MNGIATIRDVEAVEARRPGELTQTANFFQRLGAREDSVIAFVLPNLPETTDDASRGMTARLQLDPGESDVAARHVLGRFALPFTISTAGHEGAPS
jgi:hypothetical protein